jgi:hypothetical protein
MAAAWMVRVVNSMNVFFFFSFLSKTNSLRKPTTLFVICAVTPIFGQIQPIIDAS